MGPVPPWERWPRLETTEPWRVGGVQQSSPTAQLLPWRLGSSSTGGSAAALTVELAALTHKHIHTQ